MTTSSSFWGAVVVLCTLVTIAMVALRARRSRCGRAREPQRRACPHLGLANDPFARHEVLTEEHRCYVYLQRDRVDLAHQRIFCLSGRYRRCPWLAIRPSNAAVPLPARLRAAMRSVAGAAWRGARRQSAAASLAALRGEAHAYLRRLPALLAHALAVSRPVLCRTLVAVGRSLRTTLAHAVTSLRALALAVARLSWRGARASWQRRRTVGAVWRAVSASMTRRSALAASPPLAVASDTTTERGVPSAVARPSQVEQAGDAGSALAPAAGPMLVAHDEVAFANTPPLVQPTSPAQTLLAEARAADLPARGIAAVEAGREAEAHDLFRAAVAESPRSARAWFWVAKTAPTLDELIYALEHALALAPDDEKLKVSLVWALRRREHARRLAAGATDAPAQTHGAVPAIARQWLNAFLATLAATFGNLARAAGAAAAILLGAAWLVGGLPPELRAAWPVDDHGLAPFVPALDLARAPAPAGLELWPGYNILTAGPFVLGFLALLIAAGLLDREGWARLWGPVLAVASVVLWPDAVGSAPAHPALALGGLVALASLATPADEVE